MLVNINRKIIEFSIISNFFNFLHRIFLFIKIRTKKLHDFLFKLIFINYIFFIYTHF